MIIGSVVNNDSSGYKKRGGVSVLLLGVVLKFECLTLMLCALLCAVLGILIRCEEGKDRT